MHSVELSLIVTVDTLDEVAEVMDAARDAFARGRDLEVIMADGSSYPAAVANVKEGA